MKELAKSMAVDWEGLAGRKTAKEAAKGINRYFTLQKKKIRPDRA